MKSEAATVEPLNFLAAWQVALKAMGLKKELDKEVGCMAVGIHQDRCPWCQAASNDLRQEERQEELEQLEEEVDALKERTAKAKELLRPGRLFRDSKLVPSFPVAGSTRN